MRAASVASGGFVTRSMGELHMALCAGACRRAFAAWALRALAPGKSARAGVGLPALAAGFARWRLQATCHLSCACFCRFQPDMLSPRVSEALGPPRGHRPASHRRTSQLSRSRGTSVASQPNANPGSKCMRLQTCIPSRPHRRYPMGRLPRRRRRMLRATDRVVDFRERGCAS